MNTIFAIGVHLDDGKIHCGGTLVRFLKSGYKIIIVYV